jgi:FG-GAP-like repeat
MRRLRLGPVLFALTAFLLAQSSPAPIGHETPSGSSPMPASTQRTSSSAQHDSRSAQARQSTAGSPAPGLNFASAVTYSSGGQNLVSVAVADVNGDGKPDLVALNRGSGTIGVLLGNGDGTFLTATTYFSGGGRRQQCSRGRRPERGWQARSDSGKQLCR